MIRNVRVRAARPQDLPEVRALERAAGAVFGALGMAAVADDVPPSIAELTVFQQDGRAWVITDDSDSPVAYLLLDVVDGNAHVEQVSVHPDHARQSLGKTLLDTVAAWAQQRGLAAQTLTTYAHVPWNAPYYHRLGFQVMTEDQMTAGLRRIRDHEQARRLDQWPRVTMRRPLGSERSAVHEVAAVGASGETISTTSPYDRPARHSHRPGWPAFSPHSTGYPAGSRSILDIVSPSWN